MPIAARKKDVFFLFLKIVYLQNTLILKAIKAIRSEDNMVYDINADKLAYILESGRDLSVWS